MANGPGRSSAGRKTGAAADVTPLADQEAAAAFAPVEALIPCMA